ncbi:uncharacterized protein LOC144093782 isoform X1 [Amblyomma americanum]
MANNNSRTHCCVVGCSNTYLNSPGTRFYGFPTRHWETERRERWIRLIRRQNEDGTDWMPSRKSKICSRHFVSNAKSNEEGHPSYYPSIFPSAYKKASTSGSSGRHDRRKERESRKHDQQIDDDPRPLNAVSPDANSPLSGGDETTSQKKFADACTMTDMEPECLSGEFTFISTTSNCNASCYVHHRTSTTAERGTSCDSAQLCDKNVGPVRKQPYFGGFRALHGNEAALQSFTAVSFQLFSLLLSVLPPGTQRLRELSVEDKLLLLLMKLKHSLPFSFLASLFCVHSTTASRVFKSVLVNIKVATKDWIYWPSRLAVQRTMPPSFKRHYDTCRAIIDCTEIETEMPPDVETRNLWFSHYKGRYTLKYLICIAPNGAITFVSEGYGGRTSDATITVDGKLLSLLEPGDVILADKGFPGIRTDVGVQQATLVMPPFATNAQFTESEVDATYETASVRIHVERVIQRLKTFNILSQRIPHELTGYVDDIVHVVAVITNLKPGIFARNECNVS